MFKNQVLKYALCVVLSMCLPAKQALAQDPVLIGLSGLTLDEALNKIADRVDSSIEKAGTVANGVVIRAGSEVWAEIENMRTSAKDVLNKAVKDLNQTLKMQLAQVSSDANALERKTAEDAQRVLVLAQGVGNQIPFSKTQPQVSSLSPSYGVFDPAAPQSAFLLRVNGNFFDSALTGFAPYITASGKKIDPTEVTTSHMIFSVPTSLFAPIDGKFFPVLKLPIVVPYRETHALFFHSKKEAHFIAALIGLPGSPGQIVITTQSTIEVAHRDAVSTPQDNIQSDRDDHDENRCGPNETRAIDPSSVAIHLDHVEGSTWTQHPVRLNNPSVCWHFRTEHHGIGTSDKLFFHFTYFVTYTLPVVQSNTQTFALKWGDSKVINAPPGTVTISFTGFDGSSQQYTAGNHEGGGFRIAARPLEGILLIN